MKIKFITKRIIPIVFVVTFFLLLKAPNVCAVEIISHEKINLDTSLIREDKNFSIANSILIAPIFPPDNGMQANEQDWFRGLYYYTVQKLGFSDIPFHYIVSESGNIYEGNEGGDERRVSVQGIGSEIIVIGYMSKLNSNSFSSRAEKSLEELILKISNDNSIKPENTQVKSINFLRDETNKTVTLEAKDIFGLWENTLRDIISKIKNRYNPVQKVYNLQFLSVTLPSEEIEPGETATGNIKVKNTGQNGFYGGGDSAIVLSNPSEGTSAFFVNNIWISTQELLILEDGQILLPGEEGQFEFNLKAPLHIGEYKENFKLKTLGGTDLTEASIEIKLTMKRTERQIVEIDTQEYGFVYVRVNPYQGAEVLRNVVTGERFFLLQEDLETGWVQIDLGDGTAGWIAYWFLNYL